MVYEETRSWHRTLNYCGDMMEAGFSFRSNKGTFDGRSVEEKCITG